MFGIGNALRELLHDLRDVKWLTCGKLFSIGLNAVLVSNALYLYLEYFI